VLVGPRGSDPQSSGTANFNIGASGLGQYSLSLKFSQSSPTFSCSWRVTVAPTSG
jgi:hypothetical protein